MTTCDSGKSFLLSTLGSIIEELFLLPVGDPQQMTYSQALLDHLGWYDPLNGSRNMMVLTHEQALQCL